MTIKKIAIFVEGQTERMFIAKLLQEIAGYKNIYIEICQIKGSRNNRKITPLKSNIVKNAPFFALLYDCGSDSHVVSDIKQQYVSLSNNNYEKIIGVRDLFPKSLSEKVQLEKSINGTIKSLLKDLKNSPSNAIREVEINVILAVMEIEAWFLAEYKCFAKINNILTPDFILQNCGFDLINMDVETRTHPSEDLDNIYQLIGGNYAKNEEQVKNIVKYLDYEFIYLDVVKKVKQLEKLIKEIDSFLM